jgi:hypothetical protein
MALTDAQRRALFAKAKARNIEQARNENFRFVAKMPESNRRILLQHPLKTSFRGRLTQTEINSLKRQPISPKQQDKIIKDIINEGDLLRAQRDFNTDKVTKAQIRASREQGRKETREDFDRRHGNDPDFASFRKGL